MPPKLWIPGGATKSTMQYMTDAKRRAEALSLYREILRTAKHFHWVDHERTGRPWNQLLKEQAKREFIQSRRETDPLLLTRMLVTGRDCVQQIQHKFNAATHAAWKRIDTDTARHHASANAATTTRRNTSQHGWEETSDTLARRPEKKK